MKKVTNWILLIATIAIITASCKKNPATTPDPGTAYVMGINAAASTSGIGIDMLIGSRRVSGISFGSNSTYNAITAGETSVGIDFSGNVTYSSATFVRTKTYSLFAIDNGSGLSAVPIEDNLPGNTSGVTNIRFLDFSADAPLMDVFIGGVLIFPARSFNDQASNSAVTNFITMVPGTYEIELRDPASGSVLYTFNSFVIPDGKTCTLIAKGLVGGTADEAFALGLVTQY